MTSSTMYYYTNVLNTLFIQTPGDPTNQGSNFAGMNLPGDWFDVGLVRMTFGNSSFTVMQTSSCRHHWVPVPVSVFAYIVLQIFKLNWKLTFFLEVPHLGIMFSVFVARANVIIYKLARANIWIELNWIEFCQGLCKIFICGYVLMCR